MSESQNDSECFLMHVYECGMEYTGEWNEERLRHGLGQAVFADGTRYIGNFNRGLASGLGNMWFPDRTKYRGQFLQGWFHGCGMFISEDGLQFEGEFRGGRLWGHGILTFAEGKRREGYFQDGRFIRKENCKNLILKARNVVLLARRLADQWLN